MVKFWRAQLLSAASMFQNPLRAAHPPTLLRNVEEYQEISTVDKSSIGGVLLAIAGIIAGLLLEGGRISQLLQPTAALIVFCGTLGAVLLQFPLSTVAGAF